MAKDTAVRTEITEAFLKSIVFAQRIVAIDGDVIHKIATPSTTKDWIVRDRKTPGFAIRVYAPTDSDSKARIAFIVQRKMTSRPDDMGGRKSAPVRRVIDEWPRMSVTAARKQAAVWFGLMTKGIDPLSEKKANLEAQAVSIQSKSNTFGKLYKTFCEDGSGVAPSTKKDREKVIEWLKESPLWKCPVNAIAYPILESTFDPLFQWSMGQRTKPGWGPKKPDLATVWKCFRYSQGAYSFTMAASGQGMMGRGESLFSVLRAKKKKSWPLPTARPDFLDTSEDTSKKAEQGRDWVRKLVGLRSDPRPQIRVFADYLICLLIWGGRRHEAQMLRWDDVDVEAETGMFRAENTKSKKKHWFPLTPWILEILTERRKQNQEWGRDGEWVFPSREHGKHIADHRGALEVLNKETGLWLTAHDLRRTAAIETAGLTKSDSLVTSMMLAHSGGKKEVTKGYLVARVRLLRPFFIQRENRLRQLAGLGTIEPELGAIESLIAFLEQAKHDAGQRDSVEKRAAAMLTMLV